MTYYLEKEVIKLEKLFKELFNMYVTEEFYERNIIKDEEYISISKVLVEFDKQLENHYDNNFINELTSTYMNLCNVYRKYDYTNGLLIGIILGNRLTKTHNSEFLYKCYKQIKDLI